MNDYDRGQTKLKVQTKINYNCLKRQSVFYNIYKSKCGIEIKEIWYRCQSSRQKSLFQDKVEINR